MDKPTYWRFLRRVYGMGALEAWEYIDRVGTPPDTQWIRFVLATTKPRRDR
jgi:hypothetical protein